VTEGPVTAPTPGALPTGQHRDAIVAEVARVLADLAEGATVVVAISGGPDSTALAYLAAEARPDLDLALGHVRHGLREDAHDVATVEAHARALGVPLYIATVDVRSSGEGVEAAARRERYRALGGLVGELGATALLVGHTAEDQAETVLLRAARGTGLEGLAAMAPASALPEGPAAARLLRPLLRLRRSDVRGFVTQEGLDAVEDPMNRDRASRRVRVRHEVLPALEGVGDDPVGALARLADLARDEMAYLDRVSVEGYARLHRRYGPGRALPSSALAEVDRAAARRLVRHLILEAAGEGRPPDASHVEAVLGLAPGTAIDVPGASVTAGGGWVAAVPQDVRSPNRVELTVPGITPWEAGGVEIVATAPAPDRGQMAIPLDPWTPPLSRIPPEAVPPGGDVRFGAVLLGPEPVERGLIVRRRLPGDRLVTPAGTRKLQDILVDAGVPRALRDLVPVVVVRAGPVVWVPGVAVDRVAATAGSSTPMLHLAVRAGV
jgi:tRNA(Ile)-lysidine synthase